MFLNHVTFLAFLSVSTILLLDSSKAAKILLLPASEGSHLLNFIQIGSALAEKGHELHSVLNDGCKNTKKLTDFGVINHGFKRSCLMDGDEMKKMQMDLLTTGFSLSQMNAIPTMARLIDAEYAPFFKDETITALKKENFDIAILDAIVYLRPLYVLPYRLGIPTISIAAVTGLLDTGIPALPSFTPLIREGKFSSKMTFTERVHNTLLTLLMDKATGYLLGQTNAVTRYAPDMPYKTMEELQAESALWLIMNDGAIDYPQVSLPHVINIGGINTGPAKPLKEDFQKIADGAKEGLVIVSFGSAIGDFPPVLREKMFNDLKLVKETVIWRYTAEIPDDLPSNMHLVKWMPQNDLLAHPNTKVFVTHCGCNGQFEALYSGIPMVGIPLFGDQNYNAVRMVQKGMGVKLDLLGFKSGELHSAIQEVMHNESYTKAMKKYSTIFKSQPMKPMERAVFWIEHVLEHGYEHLHSPGIDMPWYQYWCIDVLLFLILVISLVASVFVLFMCFVYRKIRACFKKEKPSSAFGKRKKKSQ